MYEIDNTLRTAVPTDRSHLANLIHFGAYIHQHLDWKPALDWIGSRPYLLMEKRGEILATLACPPELPDVAWIRLYAASSLVSVREAWEQLWISARQELAGNKKIHIAAISLQAWFNELLLRSRFEQVDEVIILLWERAKSLPKPRHTDISVRPMYLEDLEVVESIDHEAFDSIWKNSRESLELAFQQSSLASVAETGGDVVGYQVSTSSSMGGHLARLAVRSEMQGKGIGFSLVYDLLTQLEKQGVGRVTVNTQKSNTSSLALYNKAGFRLTGETYQVYQHDIG